MPVQQITLDIKEDGQTLPGFPLTQQTTTTESLGRSTYDRASGAGYVELALGDLNGVTVLFVKANQATTLRFNDQSDAGLPIDANGYVLLVGAAIPDTATSKAALDNATGNVATIQQIAAGS